MRNGGRGVRTVCVQLFYLQSNFITNNCAMLAWFARIMRHICATLRDVCMARRVLAEAYK